MAALMSPCGILIVKICEMVGIYLLSKLIEIVCKGDTSLYHNDDLMISMAAIAKI